MFRDFLTLKFFFASPQEFIKPAFPFVVVFLATLKCALPLRRPERFLLQLCL